MNFITSLSGGGTRTDSYWVGFKAQVGTPDLLVTALGRWIVSPGGVHLINLLDVNGALLGQVSLNTAGQTPNTFAYQTLAPAITLRSETVFYVVSQENNADPWLNYDATVTTTSDALIQGAVYILDVGGPGTGVVPTVGGAGVIAYVPPNFQYTFLTPTTPFSGPGKFVIGITPGTIRHDYTSYLGYQFQVGARDLPVTALGRWVLPNTTGTSVNHFLRLLDNSGNILREVYLSIAGIAPGNFAYGTLASPITLSAGATYYLLCRETLNADDWYSTGVSDTVLTTSADATILNGAFTDPGKGDALTFYPVPGGPHYGYVPPDLYYSFAAPLVANPQVMIAN
jgi:hypothetical protein